jgi:hypothetical protein
MADSNPAQRVTIARVFCVVLLSKLKKESCCLFEWDLGSSANYLGGLFCSEKLNTSYWFRSTKLRPFSTVVIRTLHWSVH